MNGIFNNNDNRFYYIFLTLILLCISVLVCWNANWVLGDDVQFVTTTGIGKLSHSRGGDGRFWPLGLCDYSILSFIPYGNTPLAHFVYTAIIMSAAVFLFFNSLIKITQSAPISLFIVLVLMFCSSFLKIHLQCIFPERIVFLMFSIFIFCFLRREKSLGFQLGAWLSATYAIFCKEPIFGLFLIFSVLGLLFYRKKNCDSTLYYSILFSSISYIAIYVYRLLFRAPIETIYSNAFENSIISSFNVFVFQLKNEPILLLLLLVGIVRIYHVIKNRQIEFTDILALSGWGYIFAYTLLGISFSMAYYCFPALVFIYLGFALTIKEDDWKFLRNSSIGVVCCLVCLCGYSIKYYQMDIEEIRAIFYLRKHDMPLVNMLAGKLIDGQKIVFISKANRFSGKDKVRIMGREKYLFEMWNHFLTFVIGRKITQENGVKLQDDIPNEKCIVISESDYPNIRRLREKCCGCNIYEYEPSANR